MYEPLYINHMLVEYGTELPPFTNNPEYGTELPNTPMEYLMNIAHRE